MILLPEDYGTEILRVVAGSNLHGTNVGTGDRDEMGIYVERPESTIGLNLQHHDKIWAFRSAGGENPSGENDVDLTIHSLRHWVGLAANGNPNSQLLLFAPEHKVIFSSTLGEELREHPEWFISRRCGEAHLGFFRGQRARLTGDRGRAGRVRERGVCENCSGEGVVYYADGGAEPCPPCGGSGRSPDWKYAMHMLRLVWQGIEMMKTGRLQLPIQGLVGARLRAVRCGEVSMEDVLGEAANAEVQLEKLVSDSTLPPKANYEAIEQWMIDAHLLTWEMITCPVDHARYCCAEHSHHTMPHKGCIMR